jgi:DNA-binding MarR family transcriptional regulator
VKQKDSVGFQILRAIRRIIRRTSAHSRNISRDSGVSVPQMLCLKTIAELSANGEATVATVAERVQLSPPTASRILDRLEKANYILRERATTDRRKVIITLTEQGRARIGNLPQPLHEQFLNRLHALSPEDQLELLRALERIVDLMDAADIDAAPVLTAELEVGPDPISEEATPLTTSAELLDELPEQQFGEISG